MKNKKQSYELISHPLEEITFDGETFRAIFMTENEILEFAERFQKLKPSIKQVIMDLWDYWSGCDAPWVVAEHIHQYNHVIEQKYKTSIIKKRKPKITSTGLPLPPSIHKMKGK